MLLLLLPPWRNKGVMRVRVGGCFQRHTLWKTEWVGRKTCKLTSEQMVCLEVGLWRHHETDWDPAGLPWGCFFVQCEKKTPKETQRKRNPSANDISRHSELQNPQQPVNLDFTVSAASPSSEISRGEERPGFPTPDDVLTNELGSVFLMTQFDVNEARGEKSNLSYNPTQSAGGPPLLMLDW